MCGLKGAQEVIMKDMRGSYEKRHGRMKKRLNEDRISSELIIRNTQKSRKAEISWSCYRRPSKLLLKAATEVCGLQSISPGSKQFFLNCMARAIFPIAPANTYDYADNYLSVQRLRDNKCDEQSFNSRSCIKCGIMVTQLFLNVRHFKANWASISSFL